MAVYVNFQRFMNLTINSHRNPYFEKAFVTVGTLWHPYSQASKKVKENIVMVWLISHFSHREPELLFSKGSILSKEKTFLVLRKKKRRRRRSSTGGNE